MSSQPFESGSLYRLCQIIGTVAASQTRNHKVVHKPVIPISRSNWYAGVKSGRYPPSVSIGEKSQAWRGEQLNETFGAE